MPDVIELDTYRPHFVAQVQCYECEYCWTAVAPVGTTALECPNCGHMEPTEQCGGLSVAAKEQRATE